MNSTPFCSRFSSFFGAPALFLLSVVSFAVAPCTGSAQNAADFDFLQKYLNEAVDHLSSQDTTYGRRDELAAALNTAEKGNLPTVGIEAETSLSKSFQYHDSKRLNPDDKALGALSAGITARQNLYSGGITGMRIDAAQFRLNAQTLSVADRTHEVRLAVVKDVVSILGLRRSTLLKKSVVEQANTLASIAQRKLKSGVLGVKEAVEANREALRAANDFAEAQLSLQTQISNFNSKYLLTQNPLREQDLPGLEATFVSLFQKGDNVLSSPQLVQSVTEKTSSLKQSGLEEQATETDFRVARAQEYNPSLDFSLGLQGSFNDLSNTPAQVRAEATNRQWQPNARLSFSMSLFNPTGAAQIEEVAARKKSILAERQNILNSIELKFKSALLERTSQQGKLKGLKQVTQLSQDIRQKDGRLFDAGEIDIEQVIRDQQELNSENAAIVDLENQLRTLFADTLHNGTFGYVSETGAGK